MLTKWVSLINLRVINPVFDELGRQRRVLKLFSKEVNYSQMIMNIKI